ncbi:hypothetical protein CHLNCDRAFT_140840 [Chlorella variabilis]|uniref:Methanethiol oxidase n=1 Tax=Chlorella variabilis TaxID=554065 RepID=E1Z6B7_CHLVA|nr:hypothetical protein CHLNCDRAFT_140840 [Chlorella variabilis]EFN58621.1 hypothetical protein CHLNCDRAFT_140840 [Chlorella variabilis]|eukprot:XP_005850723.1 hypothetical protein CHLNCDRAFT_140840 [Chlorella variabilis]
MACCEHSALGWATPGEAFRSAEREKILYVVCTIPKGARPDFLATIDADEASPTFSQVQKFGGGEALPSSTAATERQSVIARTPVPYTGDELHHSGWNACSSCGDKSGKARKYLVAPALGSSRVYAFDVATDPRKPSLAKIVEPEEIKKTGLSYLHSSHCLADGNVMISGMGDPEGNNKGGFVLLDGETFKARAAADSVKDKTWSQDTTEFGYDFWYQPHHDLLVSTSWGAPSEFFKGFNPAEVATKYGDQLYIWSWKERELVQKTRFLHDPWKAHGYVGAALSSNVIHISKEVNGSVSWKTNVAIKQPWVKVEGWVLPEMPPLITDILVSMDDKYLYFSNWLRGDLVQYDVSDPANPKFSNRIWLGGSLRKGGPVKVIEGLPEDSPEQPEVPTVKGVELQGGPQMIQLSLDGRRLYVTNSLFSPWDHQFYPDMPKKVQHMLVASGSPPAALS